MQFQLRQTSIRVACNKFVRLVDETIMPILTKSKTKKFPLNRNPENGGSEALGNQKLSVTLLGRLSKKSLLHAKLNNPHSRNNLSL